MSTNSFIGVSCDDGVRFVYCHFDGGLWGVGSVLGKFYNDFMKTCTLINEGDISVLNREIGEKHDFNWDINGSEEYAAHGREWTTFYTRDRGEEDAGYTHVESEAEFIDFVRRYGASFAYLFDNGSWKYWDLHNGIECAALADAV